MSDETTPNDHSTTPDYWALIEQVQNDMVHQLRLHDNNNKSIDGLKVLTAAKEMIQQGLHPEKLEPILFSSHDILLEYWNKASKRKNTITTGFKSLDDILSGGVESERLITLLGAPNTGKTTFAHQMAETMADRGRPVLYVTSEDSPNALLAKTIARVGGIDYTPVLKAWPDHETRIKATILELLDRTSSQRLHYLDSTNGVDLIAIKDAAKAHFARFTSENGGGPGILFVDYLQRIARAMKRKLSIKNELREVVTDVAEELRAIAKDLDCAVIAIASQNRGGYTRGEAGSLASAKESGDVEYTTDVMLALTEDKERKKTVPHLTPIALHIDKNRQGPKDVKVALDFYANRQQFTEAGK
jgi:replicative DNA helicase